MPYLDGTTNVHGICTNRQNWSKLKVIVIELLSVGSVVTSDAVRSKPELFEISYCPEVVFMEPREQSQ